MPKILLEDSYRFVPDPTFVSENFKRDPGQGPAPRRFPLEIPGLLSECGKKNGNGRVYTRKVWESQLTPGAVLHTLLAEREAWGRLEHPKDGMITLESPLTHLVTSVWLEGDQLKGKVMLANTPEGNRIYAMMECGWLPLLSSRGFGSITKGSDGIDYVQEDYVCEGWDFVKKPSFANCKLDPASVRAAISGKTESTDGPFNVSATESLRLEPGVTMRMEGGVMVVSASPTAPIPPAAPQAPAAAPAISAVTPPSASIASESQTMTTKLASIRESIASLRSIKPETASVDELARGLSRMESLHREAVSVQVETPASTYDVELTRKEIAALESQWKAAADAPRDQVKKLTENQGRLVRVAHLTAKHALNLRTKLGESIKRSTKVNESLTVAVSRGRAWMNRALRAEGKNAVSEQRLELAYAALDYFAEKYNTDIARMGGKILQLEFKPDATVVKRIKEAKKPSQILKIREELDSARGGKPAAPAAPAPTNESRLIPAAPLNSLPSTVAAPAAPAASNLSVTSFTRDFTISESVDMVARLRRANAEQRGDAQFTPAPAKA